MTSEPAVTVIISTHNRAAYLPDVLHSLAAQTCDVPYEFVVIDNASTDGTMAVLTEWCRIDPRFRVALEPRLGLSYGKNAGVRMARAPLLIFTDDDMVIDQRWLQSYVNLFAQHEGELMLAGGPCMPIPSDLGPWPDWFDERGMADVGLLQYRSRTRFAPDGICVGRKHGGSEEPVRSARFLERSHRE